ncbi:MAG TPA: PfkB family carbohydrate kinase, partial [Trebonia sp.]|nr:PfkB family carbohydrate kinase [Trebonia sp.]
MIIPNGPCAPPQPSIPLQPGRPARLVFAGEAIVDVLMRVPGLPPRGGDLLATSSEVAVGGGFNVMAAAARQGLPVLYAGGHGTGPWGDLVRAALAAEGIRLLRPPDPSADTGFDVALVEPDAERTFITSLGAESSADPAGWDAIEAGLAGWDATPAGPAGWNATPADPAGCNATPAGCNATPAGPGDAVYVSGYGLVAPGSGPALAAWAAALPAGVLLFFDPGPLVAQIPDDVLAPVLARCDWLSCNAREATLLTSATAPDQAARALLALTPHASIIVRIGPDGCYLATRPTATTTPPGPPPAITPPGAPPAITPPGAPPTITPPGALPTITPPTNQATTHLPAPTAP